MRRSRYRHASPAGPALLGHDNQHDATDREGSPVRSFARAPATAQMTNLEPAKRRMIRGGAGMIFLAPAIIVGLVISGSAASAASQPNGDKMLPAHWVS